MKKYLFLLIAFILSGCPSVNVTPSDRVPLQLPSNQPLILKKVEFKVIHKDNAESIFTEMEKQDQTPLLIGLQGKDYKALSENMKEISNFMIIQNKIIEAYKKYYEENK